MDGFGNGGVERFVEWGVYGNRAVDGSGKGDGFWEKGCMGMGVRLGFENGGWVSGWRLRGIWS